MATLNLFRILLLTHKHSRHPSTENVTSKVACETSFERTFSRLRAALKPGHWRPERCFRGELTSYPVFPVSLETHDFLDKLNKTVKPIWG